MTTSGLEYPLDGAMLDPGSTRGVSNVFTERRPRVETNGDAARNPPRRATREGLVNCVASVGSGGRRHAGGRRREPHVGGDRRRPTEVVLLTHDSFAVSKEVKTAFERESGLTLRILQAGDANETLNRALLTAGDPQGDVIFGIDDSVLSRALGEDLLEEYGPKSWARRWTQTSRRRIRSVTPIDHGEVCLNVDVEWFAAAGRAAGRRSTTSLDRVPRTCSSSRTPPRRRPGLAFLLATIAPSARPVERVTGAGSGRTASLAVDGWEEAYTSSSPARRAARASGRSSSRTPRARPPR